MFPLKHSAGSLSQCVFYLENFKDYKWTGSESVFLSRGNTSDFFPYNDSTSIPQTTHIKQNVGKILKKDTWRKRKSK